MNALEEIDSVFHDSTGGEILRHAREALGLSQKNVAAEINLLVSHVRAIDDDRYDVQNENESFKECIEAYAELVGVDKDMIWELYMTQIPEAEPILDRSRAPVMHLYNPRNKIIAVASFTTLFLAIGVWLFYATSSQQMNADSETAVAADSSNRPAPVDSPAEQPVPPPAQKPEGAHKVQSLVAVPPVYEPRIMAAKVELPEPAPKPKSKSKPKPKPKSNPNEFSGPAISDLYYPAQANDTFDATRGPLANILRSNTARKIASVQPPASNAKEQLTEAPGAAVTRVAAQKTAGSGQQFSVIEFGAASIKDVGNKVSDVSTHMLQFAKVIQPFIKPAFSELFANIKADYVYRTIPPEALPAAATKSDAASFEQKNSARNTNAAARGAGEAGMDVKSDKTINEEQQAAAEADIWQVSDVEIIDKYLYSTGE